MPTVVDLLVGTLLLGPISVIFLADGTSSVRNLFQEFAALSPLCRIGLFAFWLCYKHLLGWVRLLAIADVTAPEDLTAIRRSCREIWSLLRRLQSASKTSSEGIRRSEALLRMMVEALGRQIDQWHTPADDLHLDMLRPDEAQEVGMPVDISTWTLQRVLDELMGPGSLACKNDVPKDSMRRSQATGSAEHVVLTTDPVLTEHAVKVLPIDIQEVVFATAKIVPTRFCRSVAL